MNLANMEGPFSKLLRDEQAALKAHLKGAYIKNTTFGSLEIASELMALICDLDYAAGVPTSILYP